MSVIDTSFTAFGEFIKGLSNTAGSVLDSAIILNEKIDDFNNNDVVTTTETVVSSNDGANNSGMYTLPFSPALLIGGAAFVVAAIIISR